MVGESSFSWAFAPPVKQEKFRGAGVLARRVNWIDGAQNAS